MPQIGTLTTGAGVTTVIAGQSKLDQFLLLGDVDTANPLQGISVEVEGTSYFSIANAATLITALQKWQQQLTGAVLGILLKISTGVINRTTTYRLTNAGATTPAVFAFSEAPNGLPMMVSTATINALSSLTLQRFSAVFIQTPANVDKVEVEFMNGYRETMTIQEVDARYSLYNQSEADGRLGGVSVINNTDQKIRTVRISTNNVGALTVALAKLPDDAFDKLNR
jgi:hypothetical protein